MHEVRSFFHERTETRDAFRALQIEADAAMHAALSEVTKQIRRVVVLGVQRVEIPQVASQLVRRDRRVVPSWPHRARTLHGRNSGSAAFANLPELLLLPGV